jgi:hypothetical protein
VIFVKKFFPRRLPSKQKSTAKNISNRSEGGIYHVPKISLFFTHKNEAVLREFGKKIRTIGANIKDEKNRFTGLREDKKTSSYFGKSNVIFLTQTLNIFHRFFKQNHLKKTTIFNHN